MHTEKVIQIVNQAFITEEKQQEACYYVDL